MRTQRHAVPKAILERIRRVCLALPDAREEPAWVGTRFTVRKRNFAHVLRIDRGWPPAYARAAGSDGPLDVLTFRAPRDVGDAVRDGESRLFFARWSTRWETNVLGMALTNQTDWKEVTAYLEQSHALLAGQGKRGRARG